MSQARDAALHATARQKAFTSSASHELRTPTTSIVGFIEAVLESTTLSTEDRGFLEIVDRNAHRLSQLIDDLLVLGEAEIGPAMMHLESTALRPLVERVLSTFPADPEHSPSPSLATRPRCRWPEGREDVLRDGPDQPGLTRLLPGNSTRLRPSSLAS